MPEYIETIIVGGGQAGLAVSYYLTRMGREHVGLVSHGAVSTPWLASPILRQ